MWFSKKQRTQVNYLYQTQLANNENAMGSMGATGPTGPAGVGVTGSINATGPTGSSGLGSTGPIGPTGSSFLTSNSAPIIPSNDTYLGLDTYNIFKYGKYTTPTPRTIPTYSGTLRMVATLSELNSAIAASVDGDIIQITTHIDLGSGSITIPVGIKLTASQSSFHIITSSQTEGNCVIFSGNNVLVTGITIRATGAGSTSVALAFTSTTASNNYVYDAIIVTNEFGILSANPQIQIQNTTFKFVGTPDPHRYIILQRTTGETFITNCQFEGNGILSTQCVFNTSAASNYTNGKIIIKDCATITNPVSRLLLWELPSTGSNIQFFLINNTITSHSGFCIFYNNSNLDGVALIVAENNTETLSSTSSGGKGIIGLDNATSGTLFTSTNIYAQNNSPATLNPTYTDWSSDNSRFIAYATSLYSPPSKITIKSLTAWNVVGNILGPTGMANYVGKPYRDLTTLSYVQNNGTPYFKASLTATVNGFANFNEVGSILNVPGVNISYISIIYAFAGTPASTTLNFGFVNMSTGIIGITTFPTSGVSTDITNPSILEYTFPTPISTTASRCVRLAIYGGNITVSNYINIRTVVIGFV